MKGKIRSQSQLEPGNRVAAHSRPLGSPSPAARRVTRPPREILSQAESTGNGGASVLSLRPLPPPRADSIRRPRQRACDQSGRASGSLSNEFPREFPQFSTPLTRDDATGDLRKTMIGLARRLGDPITQWWYRRRAAELLPEGDVRACARRERDERESRWQVVLYQGRPRL
jgi:hypothetical protein